MGFCYFPSPAPLPSKREIVPIFFPSSTIIWRETNSSWCFRNGALYRAHSYRSGDFNTKSYDVMGEISSQVSHKKSLYSSIRAFSPSVQFTLETIMLFGRKKCASVVIEPGVSFPMVCYFFPIRQW